MLIDLSQEPDEVRYFDMKGSTFLGLVQGRSVCKSPIDDVLSFQKIWHERKKMFETVGHSKGIDLAVKILELCSGASAGQLWLYTCVSLQLALLYNSNKKAAVYTGIE